MSESQLVFPTGLCRIECEEADQAVGMGGDIRGNIAIIDPQPAQPGLAAKDDRRHRLCRPGLVFLESHRQIDLDSSPRPASLLAEVVGEMLGISPGVAVDVDNHAVDSVLTCHLV